MAQNDVFTTNLSPGGGRPSRLLDSEPMAQLGSIVSSGVASNATVPPQNLEAARRSVATDEAWAAGLFEGEGSFGLRSNGTVLLTLGSTDKDVIERFRTVIATGRISSQPPGRNRRRKRLWRVDVIQVDEVLRVINVLYPWLGARRRARADEAVAVLNWRIDTATAERACPFCGGHFRPPFTPNAARTRFCRRLCERRWHQKRRTLQLVNTSQEQIT
jgi:hypothetical protein